MFSFFRRYQRIIYFFVTAVIILSFSFFGTYSAFTSGRGEDPTVVRTVDGREITRSEFNDYVHFLSTEGLPCRMGDGELAPCNPLNDGVFSKDIIGSRVGTAIARRFASDFSAEWQQKQRREAQFKPYQHPKAPFLSALQVWSYFAPELKGALEEYQTGGGAQDAADLFSKKATLFLAEKRFPAAFLRQVLQYQQQQFGWLEPDAALDARSLSLFGYQQAQDWFGVAFLEKSTEFIIQTAAKARQSGLAVSPSEALASLYQNAQRALQKGGAEGELTAEDLVRKCLKAFNMDLSKAIAIWSDVLLFRKSLMELPSNLVVSEKPFAEYYRSKSDARDLECFQLQPCLRFRSMKDIWKFEVWLAAVDPRRTLLQPSLSLPKAFRPAEEVLISWPEFVERRFSLSIVGVSMDELVQNIRLVDLWRWQLEEAHWSLLKEAVPALGEYDGSTRDLRQEALERLAPQLRARVDDFSKEKIVLERPQWLQKALAEGKPELRVVGIRGLRGKAPVEGILDNQRFTEALLRAPLGEAGQELNEYSQDGKHFYRITVLDRASASSLVPFPELIEDGTLDETLGRVFEAAYPKIRAGRLAEFRKDDGGWRPFHEVEEKIGELYFAPLGRLLDATVEEWGGKLSEYCPPNDLRASRVAVRLLPHFVSLHEAIMNGGDLPAYTTTPFLARAEEDGPLSLEERPLQELWLATVTVQTVVSGEVEEKTQCAQAFSTPPGGWIGPRYSQELGPYFARVAKAYVKPYDEDLRNTIYEVRRVLGDEAIQRKAEQFIEEFFAV